MAQKPHSLEHTVLDEKLKLVFHYTCNPPEIDILNKLNIGTFGGLYGCEDPREVLAIPLDVYKQYNKQICKDSDVLSLQTEYLLKEIDRKHKSLESYLL